MASLDTAYQFGMHIPAFYIVQKLQSINIFGAVIHPH